MALAVEAFQPVGAVATAAAAIAAWRATRFTQRSASDTRASQREQATIDHIRQVQAEQAALRDAVGHISEDFALTDPRKANVSKLMTIWEHTAAGVNYGVFDIEVLNKLTGGAFLIVYHDCVRYIRLIRHTDIGFFDQVETLVDRILLMRRLSGYRLNRTNLKKCTKLGLDRQSLRRLTKHDGTAQLTYPQLEVLLVNEGVDGEKSLIAAATREPLYRIGRSDQALPTEMLDVMASERHEDTEAVSEWIEADPPLTRLIASTDSQVVGCVDIAPLDLESPARVGWQRVIQNASQETVPDKDKLALIQRLAIHPTHRRRSLGRMLLRQAIRSIEVSYGKVAAVEMPATATVGLQLIASEGARKVGDVSVNQSGSRIGGIF